MVSLKDTRLDAEVKDVERDNVEREKIETFLRNKRYIFYNFGIGNLRAITVPFSQVCFFFILFAKWSNIISARGNPIRIRIGRQICVNILFFLSSIHALSIFCERHFQVAVSLLKPP